MYVYYKMVRKSARYQRAKSADTGLCGNKAGLPSTVGVSLVQRRMFKSIGPGSCCKNGKMDGCSGPGSRWHPDTAANTPTTVTMIATFNGSNLITATLSSATSKVLIPTDFVIPAGLTFNATGTTDTVANFTLDAAVDTLPPDTDYTIELKAGLEDGDANKLTSATDTQQVTSDVTITITMMSGVGTTNAIVNFKFSSKICNNLSAPITASDLSIIGVGHAVSGQSVNFIGEEIGGITYQLSYTADAAIVAGDTLTIKTDTNAIFKTTNGVKIAATDAGLLGTGDTGTY